MTKKIFRSIIAVAMTVLLASLLVATGFIYEYTNNSQGASLRDELAIVRPNVEKIGVEYFKTFDSSVFRFTLVSSDGTVLYDTRAQASEMGNHLDREEIREAKKFGSGRASRTSDTLTERTIYEATRLENGNVLRIAVNQLTVGAMLIRMLPAISAIILTAVVVSLLLSDAMAKNIVKPLGELDLENPTENSAYEELSPILKKLSKQHKQIGKQVRELKQRSDEFQQITASMNEGLVLLDKNGQVISINTAAKKIFATDDSANGKNFFEIAKSGEMKRAVENAFKGENSEFREEQNGKEYQFVTNRIESEGKTIGVVVVCFDISEIAFAERNRKEFTANVSHELKTPLHTIAGYAELMANGIIKADDVQNCSEKIHTEAKRMTRLIEDIINLSRLDEGLAGTEPTNCDILAIAKSVFQTLDPLARQNNINLELQGCSVTVNGIPHLLQAIIYNLCVNGIKYNKDNGSVTVEISQEKENAVIAVRDTGIGIPPEHQSRIFERFYRVDKSHSKEVGGTGLGLSIVKHAVKIHNGKIELESETDKGTVITVKIPKS